MKFAYLALVGAVSAAGEGERCSGAADCDAPLMCGWLTYDGVAKPAQSELEGENFEVVATMYATHYQLDPREVF